MTESVYGYVFFIEIAGGVLRPNNQESSENQRRHPDLDDKRIIKNSEIKNKIQANAKQEKKQISDV